MVYLQHLYLHIRPEAKGLREKRLELMRIQAKPRYNTPKYSGICNIVSYLRIPSVVLTSFQAT